MQSILELACGNGRFLRLAAQHFSKVYGCDWAVSPLIDPLLSECPNVRFERVNLYTDAPTYSADMAVSADFLEHLETDKLLSVLRKIDAFAPKHFHKIACYDDGHCHLSVLSPAEWLSLFRAIDPTYVLERTEYRLDAKDKPVIVITKGRPFSVLSPVKLNYGCANVRMPGYIGIDIRETALGADLVMPAWQCGPFQPGTVDEIHSRHMLEHLSKSNAERTLQVWHALLKPGGVLRLIVPDLQFHARQLLGMSINWSKEPAQNLDHAMAGFYGWQTEARGGENEDAHRWGWTYPALKKALEQAGFTAVNRITSGEDSEPWHLHVKASH